MKFLRLRDPLLKILFEDSEILALDKPYGFNTHTNDSKSEHQDSVRDGLIESFSKQLDQPLFVVHRLDQTTTGVLVFAKSPEAAKKYSSFFFNREVQKTYLFVTDQKISETQLTIKSDIIHKAKVLDAETDLKLLAESSQLQLWQAQPHTGRNHQIRIHAQKAGISILGDSLYGGSSFPFLSLHNQKIEFPNGLVIESKPPVCFLDLDVYQNHFLALALFELDRRERLFKFSQETTQSLRLAHRKNQDRFGNYSLDLFGTLALLSWYRAEWTTKDTANVQALADHLKKPIAVRQMINRGKDANLQERLTIYPNQVKSESFTQWTFQENEFKFKGKSDSGQSFGLFLDQRLQRNWVSKNSQGKDVLNLFSYTCAFSVAACLGEAKHVTSVDTNKNFLNWGRENFSENSIDPQNHAFLCRDSIAFLKKCLQKNQKFDLIICDPPSFSRGENGVFKIEDELLNLVMLSMNALNPKGQLLFSTNSETLDFRSVIEQLESAAAKSDLKKFEITAVEPAYDFESPQEAPILKSFILSHK